MRNKLLTRAHLNVWLLVLLFAWGCSGNKDTSNANDPAFTKYIVAHSSGIISKASTVKISVTDEVAKGLNAYGDLHQVFSILPNVPGELKWDSVRNLVFKPQQHFSPDQEYTVSFELGKLNDIPSSLQQFVFKVQTYKPNFMVDFSGLKQTDPNDKSKMTAEGTLLANDVIDPNLLPKILMATQGTKSLKVNWESSTDNKSYKFSINGVTRIKLASLQLVLSWDGAPLNIDIKDKKAIDVPAIDVFKLVNMKVSHDPEQYILLEFSDRVSESQHLNGLIRVGKLKGLHFIRDGNTIKIIPPSRVLGQYKLKLAESIENFEGKKLGDAFAETISFVKLRPAVRFVTKGAILPSSENGLVIPFEAVNLKAVDVAVVKIFEDNMLQFLQENEINGNNELRRVGQVVAHKTIALNEREVVLANQWNNYHLDLNELIQPDPGAIYRIVVAFRQEHSIYACSEDQEIATKTEEQLEAYWSRFLSGSYYDDYYYYDDYWENRDNPCHGAFYGLRKAVSQNILASNLGLIAKSADNKTITTFVTDLKKAKPVGGAVVKMYDYQQQLLQEATTDAEGKVTFEHLKKPFFVVAEQGKEKAYLKLTDGNVLSLSRFEVDGSTLKKGLKGYVFGERGVWRPGDSIFVSFLMAEYKDKLPASHPIVFELTNSKNQVVDRQVQTKNTANYYSFRTATASDAPTGSYTAQVTVGGASFSKSLKIETVKPNRLKIDLRFNDEYIAPKHLNKGDMKVSWLHGAKGKNLNVDVEMILVDGNTHFPKFKDYIFDDPTKSFYSDPIKVFEGKTNAEGDVSFEPKVEVSAAAPGMLKAIFLTKAYENGGGFSVDRLSVPYYPYASFTGMRIVKTDEQYNALVTNESHSVELVSVSPKGELVKEKQQIEVKLYKLERQYWYSRSAGSLAYYMSRTNVHPIQKGTVTTYGGKAAWKFRVDKPMWGRFLVHVKNKVTGHSTAEVIYMDWPGWVGRSHGGAGDGATMLSFTADKKKYDLGETIRLNIPSAANGRALISIENGKEVLSTEWIDTKEGFTEHEIATTRFMTPNVYVNVTLLQPHDQTINDMPIRMYGVLPIYVEVPETHLVPDIEMKDELESEKGFTVKVSEKNGRKMTYTLAIVDEGLLSLTRYKAKDPWKHFYAKEALGIKTWDLYDQVIGAYGGELERLLAIGGDDEMNRKGGSKANRFKPVVMFLGPFTLDGGDTKKHKLTMPSYVGAVRAMVIASNDKAFGVNSKSAKVTKPVMVQGTAPRVVGPGETFKLPASIFVLKEGIKKVEVTVETNNLFTIVGDKKQTAVFTEVGEEMVNFELKSASRVGVGKITLTAKSGKHKAKYTIEMDVRSPNPEVTTTQAKAISANKFWKTDYSPTGMAGTNTLTLELSTMPPINLAKRLKYLIRYPHGCIEQTTSSVFPQLYLGKLTELTLEQKKKVAHNVQEGIKRLGKFQIYNGGFSYWPGNSDANEWGSNYAGHFLVEAKRAAYSVPETLFNNWLKYQKNKARNWTNDGPSSQLTQAYRLYTLAVAGKAEKGAMNRLREQVNLSLVAKWRLAAAYHAAGKTNTATKLIKGVSKAIDDYRELSGTFGSSIRDRAMILESLTTMGDQQEAYDVLKDVAKRLSSKEWMSTQTTAYCLIAVSQYIEKNPTASSINFEYEVNGKRKTISSKKSFTQVTLSGADGSQSLAVGNKSDGVLYARLISTGTPAAGDDTDAASRLAIKLRFLDIGGKPVQVKQLEQGTDFFAEVSITNPTTRTLKEMALTQIFPSGWEIINTRLFDIPNAPKATRSTYTDFRDDRVHQYFNIKAGVTARFMVRLNATYAGKYYLPAVKAEAMYDASIYARSKGQWIEVLQR